MSLIFFQVEFPPPNIKTDCPLLILVNLFISSLAYVLVHAYGVAIKSEMYLFKYLSRERAIIGVLVFSIPFLFRFKAFVSGQLTLYMPIVRPLNGLYKFSLALEYTFVADPQALSLESLKECRVNDQGILALSS